MALKSKDKTVEVDAKSLVHIGWLWNVALWLKEL
jgi:hypothetical protein